MNNYLQQIALRSGGVEGSHHGENLPITPLASRFGAEHLMEKGSHEGWGEVFEVGANDQANFPAPNEAAATQEPSLKPLTHTAIPPSYLKAQVQRGPFTSNRYVDQRTAIPTPTEIAPNRESTAEERPPIQKEYVNMEHIQKMSIADRESSEPVAGLKQHRQPFARTPFNKTTTEQSIIQPHATLPIPAAPAVKKVEHKLVIGKITVEVVRPAVQTKERVVVRTHQAAPATGHQDRNKLSFGLGQL